MPPSGPPHDSASPPTRVRSRDGFAASFRGPCPDSLLPRQVQEIEVFPISEVVYISIEAGAGELRSCMTAQPGPCSQASCGPTIRTSLWLRTSSWHAASPRPRMAERRWREYSGSREFHGGQVYVVQRDPEGAGSIWQTSCFARTRLTRARLKTGILPGRWCPQNAHSCAAQEHRLGCSPTWLFVSRTFQLALVGRLSCTPPQRAADHPQHLDSAAPPAERKSAGSGNWGRAESS